MASQERITVHNLAGKSEERQKNTTRKKANTPPLPPNRPQEHLRRRHPQLPEQPRIPTGPPASGHAAGAGVRGLRAGSGLLPVGPTAGVRAHEARHGGRRPGLRPAQRRPVLLDRLRRARRRLRRPRTRRLQNLRRHLDEEERPHLLPQDHGILPGSEVRDSDL